MMLLLGLQSLAVACILLRNVYGSTVRKLERMLDLDIRHQTSDWAKGFINHKEHKGFYKGHKGVLRREEPRQK